MLTKTQEQTIQEIVKQLNFKHVAIIMDGNRRWAKERFLPSAVGHQRGVVALKDTIKSCNNFGVEFLTVYAFSTENWNRKPEEVEFLMDLLAKTISNELEELHSNNVRIKFIGDISVLNKGLKQILNNAEFVTKDNTGVKLQIAFNYGARAEIVNAMKTIAKQIEQGELSSNEVTEELISNNLYTTSIPEPDLLIRTGGEMRISNYLLWQIAYSELLVIDKYWPDFNKETLAEAILEFKNRNRRFGK